MTAGPRPVRPQATEPAPERTAAAPEPPPLPAPLNASHPPLAPQQHTAPDPPEAPDPLDDPRPLDGPDPLDDPDPARAGDSAACESLLRAYVRETGTEVPVAGAPLELALPASGFGLSVPVRHRSRTGWHRFGTPTVVTPAGAAPADVALVAAAAVRETTVTRGVPPHLGTDAVARVLNSAQRTTAHLAARRAEPDPPGAAEPGFVESEQALLLGHPFHPAPKSREEASEAELRDCSPELRGSFALHWFAADPSIVVGESADGREAAELLGELGRFAGLDGDGLLPQGMLALPAHPWQARDILQRPAVQGLLADGTLRSLGAHGPRWSPTSSLRTVHHRASETMLKLSLGMRITNSRRNNLRGEMRLGVGAARLLAAGPADWLRREHPEFTVLRDHGWFSAGPGREETGLETSLRDNPFTSGGPAGLCVAGLLAERTGPGDGSPPRHRALLCRAVEHTAARHGLSTGQASARWLDRYLDVLAVPLLRLQARYGLALEPHHQNTLVALGRDGLPEAGWYRDSQGYYLAASRAEELEALLPGVADGVELVFDDALVDERVVYYLGINNLLGLIGAFGALRLAHEEDLLRRLRARLEQLRATEPGVRGVLDLMLDAPTLRCKGNYLTCVDGLDELVGDVHTQSVYVDLPNPLAEATR
ncbi:hypothetical protein MTQ01_19500 [Streptomyces sp. XM4193]|uniref:IucA/IucC family protein n=1 Tax=Streptomyces sp. XM4193 TaxID=2929782 RepID=UPI001FF9EB0E|nr:IucA/IucC family protein [Streptomyces sp. XM4193]MCK1798171.1 hypothetical protein [Streptomyces sp. XM4193]